MSQSTAHPHVGPVPRALTAARDRALDARGRQRDFQRLFADSLVPMLTVDNDRRFVAVNTAAQLVFRLPESQMVGRRIDDLTSPRHLPAMTLAWDALLGAGSVSGRYAVDLPDAGGLSVFYTASANQLPGRHLIVFMPAPWPDCDIPALPERVRAERPLALSPRQAEVLQLVADGFDVVQIASELSVSHTTVRTHLRDAMRRLGARNRAHAVALALGAGSYR